MKRLLHIILLLVVTIFVSHAQTVSNVGFYQDGNNVIVTYTLDRPAYISVRVSTNGGLTFTSPLKSVSGDVSGVVKAGENNRIVWNVLAELDKLVCDEVVFEVVATSNMHNGYQYIDLGLPSGVMWAACNIGATNPEDNGSYFAWGETSAKTSYNWNTYKYGSAETELAKYNTKKKSGRVDKITVLESDDDVAASVCGGNWRLPTLDEFRELLSKCTSEWITVNGVYGRKIIGSNGNSIFLPASGYKYPSSFNFLSFDGYYWTSTLDDSYPSHAWFLHFSSSIFDVEGGFRSFGRSIRAVYDPISK